MKIYRWLRWKIYDLLGLYAPEICVNCGIETGCCDHETGMPLCVNCPPKVLR